MQSEVLDLTEHDLQLMHQALDKVDVPRTDETGAALRISVRVAFACGMLTSHQRVEERAADAARQLFATATPCALPPVPLRSRPAGEPRW
jgi:hypothetical protein